MTDFKKIARRISQNKSPPAPRPSFTQFISGAMPRQILQQRLQGMGTPIREPAPRPTPQEWAAKQPVLRTINEFLSPTGGKAFGTDIPASPANLAKGIGNAAFMSVPGAATPVKALGIGGKVLKGAEIADIVTNPFAWKGGIAELAGKQAAKNVNKGIPTMITRQMEADLKAKGLTQEAINKLKPQEAWEIMQATPEAVKLSPLEGVDLAKAEMEGRKLVPGMAKELGIKPELPKFEPLPPEMAQPSTSQGKLPVEGAPPIKPPEVPPVTAGTPENPDFAGNIRLSKYPEELRNTIKEWANAHPQEITNARRGVRSDAQVQADAQSLLDDVGGSFSRLQKRWKPGEAWNAEEILALRGTLRSKTEAVIAAKDAVSQSNSANNLVKLKIALDEQASVQEAVSGVTSEAGRALRQFRQQAIEAGDDTARLEALLKKYGGRDKIQEVADLLGKLDLNDPVQVNNFIRSFQKSHAFDFLTDIYYNAILSGPKTHIINALSNTFNAIVSPLERVGSVVVEAPLSAIQGRARERFWSEIPADSFGAVQGLSEGFRNFGYVMKTGIRPDASKFEMAPKAFKGTAGKLINLPSTALEAADTLGRAINYRAAFNAEAIRMVKIKGLKGQALVEALAELKSNPTRELLERADKIAEYRLFRQEAGKFASGLMGIRDSVSIGGFKPFRFIIPFVRTPANLLKYGLERSPAGWLNPGLWRNIAKKSPEAADQIAKAAMGSMAAASIAWYVQEGKITGAAPTSPAERDRFYRDGKQPFSIRIGDTWVPYQRLEPFNQVLAQVSATMDALKNNEKDAGQKVSQVISTLGQNLISQTYLSGLSNIVDALSQPEQYAGNLLSRFGQALLTPASSASRTVAQMMDKTVRQPQNFGDVMKSGVPGLSEQVMPKVTAFGEEVTRQSPAWSPINISPSQETALTTELDRLKVNIGFVGSSIAGVDLTPDQKQAYQIYTGQLIKQELSKLIGSPTYRGYNDVAKSKAIDSIATKARNVARDWMTKQMKLGQSSPATSATRPSGKSFTEFAGVR